MRWRMDDDELAPSVELTSAGWSAEMITTALDVLGLLALAAGVSWGLWLTIGPWGVAVGGIVILAASRHAAKVAARAAEPARPAETPTPRGAAGPRWRPRWLSAVPALDDPARPLAIVDTAEPAEVAS